MVIRRCAGPPAAPRAPSRGEDHDPRRLQGPEGPWLLLLRPRAHRSGCWLMTALACWNAWSGCPNPRDPLGVQHALTSLLLAAMAAVLAGARSFTAVGGTALPHACGSAARLWGPSA
jgi:hypothetical protein